MNVPVMFLFIHVFVLSLYTTLHVIIGYYQVIIRYYQALFHSRTAMKLFLWNQHFLTAILVSLPSLVLASLQPLKVPSFSVTPTRM